MNISGKHVLIIDDDEVICQQLSRILENIGCVPLLASSIKGALNKFKEQLPDIVILDLGLPELDGFSFLKFRQMNKLLATLPVIVLTGSKKKGDMEKCLAMGADHYLEKPLVAGHVIQKIRYVFLAKDNFTYRFPKDQMPKMDVSMEGQIVEYAPGYFYIESQAKFSMGKSIKVEAIDYVKRGGGIFVAKVDQPVSEINDGLFRSRISVTGLSAEEKERFDLWQKELNK